MWPFLRDREIEVGNGQKLNKTPWRHICVRPLSLSMKMHFSVSPLFRWSFLLANYYVTNANHFQSTHKVPNETLNATAWVVCLSLRVWPHYALPIYSNKGQFTCYKKLFRRVKWTDKTRTMLTFPKHFGARGGEKWNKFREFAYGIHKKWMRCIQSRDITHSLMKVLIFTAGFTARFVVLNQMSPRNSTLVSIFAALWFTFADFC